MEKFEVLPEDIEKITTREFTYAGGEKEGQKGIGYRCGFTDEQHANMERSSKEAVIEHMATCWYNPRKEKWGEECKAEWQRLFDTFQIENPSEYQAALKAPTALKDRKFLMGSGYYHKAVSNPNGEIFDLIRVTNETDEAYLGNFVFGMGMMYVIFPKDKVRELTEEEVKEFHGQNIAINSNLPHASLNIKEDKYDQPV